MVRVPGCSLWTLCQRKGGVKIAAQDSRPQIWLMSGERTVADEDTIRIDKNVTLFSILDFQCKILNFNY